MANTVFVNLQPDRWTLISSVNGFATNESIKKVIYVESNALPAAASVRGHTLEDTPGAFFQFTLTSGQAIYGRGVNGAALIAVTPED